LSEEECEGIREELREVADEFLRTIQEVVDSYVLLGDVERLGRLVSVVNMHTSYELVKTIREKGFSKELTILCDKVGRGESLEM